MKTGRLLLVIAMVCQQACGSRPTPAPAAAPEIDLLSLQIRTSAGVNDGRSIRMVIRRVTSKQFLTDTYPALVALAEKPDETILSDQLLRPNTSIRLRLPLEAGSSVGVYFFYARPQAESWRLLVPSGLGDATIEAQQHAAYLLK